MLVTRGGLAVKRKCTDGDSFRMRLLAAACAVNVLHIAAVADTYYWLPERGVKADASNLSNWSIEFDSEAKAPVADAHPTRMPTASDELCATRDFHFDFNGESLAFKSMNAAATSPYTGILYWGGPGEGWTFENGSLSVENLTQRIRTGDSMLLTNGMHLTCSQLFSPGNGMGLDGICDIDIADGCALVAAKTAFANGHIHVAEGGSFSTELLLNSGAQNSCVLENRGLTEFGRIDIASTAPASYGVTIRQLSGTMTFGGQVSRNGGSGGLALEMSGGSVRASGDVCFDDVGSAVAVAGSTIGAIVDDGCVMHMGEFTYGDGVTLRKMGKGELRFGNATPSSLVVAEGALHAIGAGEYGDYISVEQGGELRFRTPGISCTAFAFQNGAKCSIDIGNFPLGSTILQCKSDETLAKVKALLEAWLSEQGSNRMVAKVADTLVLSYAVDGTFDAASGLAFDDPKGWASGAVPALGSEVEITGAGVVDVTPSSPAFGLVHVAGGATLRLSGGTEADPFEMPAIQLAADAGLAVANGANWAGAVLANGCAELFNADEDGRRIPSGATFGSIRFAGTFPLCVWKNGGVACGDRLDLCSEVSGRGAFQVAPQDGAEFAVGDGYDFGTYPAGAKLPSVGPKPWWFEARPCDGDAALVVLRLVYKPHGLMMTIR